MNPNEQVYLDQLTTEWKDESLISIPGLSIEDIVDVRLGLCDSKKINARLNRRNCTVLVKLA